MNPKNLNISNFFSMLRLLITLPLSYCLWVDNKPWILALVIVAAISDFLDGYFARKLNQITELGKLLDPIADKTIVAVSVTVLLIAGKLPFWFWFLVLGRDFFILLFGLYIKSKFGAVLTANLLGKITVNVISLVVIISVFFTWKYLTYAYIFATIFMLASLASYLSNALRKIGENR